MEKGKSKEEIKRQKDEQDNKKTEDILNKLNLANTEFKSLKTQKE